MCYNVRDKRTAVRRGAGGRPPRATRALPVALLLALCGRLALGSPPAEIYGVENWDLPKLKVNDKESIEILHEYEESSSEESIPTLLARPCPHDAVSLPERPINAVLEAAWKLHVQPLAQDVASSLLLPKEENKHYLSKAQKIFQLVMQVLGNTEFTSSSERGSLLHFLAEANEVAAVRALLAAGMNASALDNRGDTPLHWAVRARAHETLRLLVEAGSSPLALDFKGLTPIDIGSKNNDTKSLAILHETTTGCIHKHATSSIDSSTRSNKEHCPFDTTSIPGGPIDDVLLPTWKLRAQPFGKGVASDLLSQKGREEEDYRVRVRQIFELVMQTLAETEFCTSHDQGSLLHFLVQSNEVEAVRELIAAGVNTSILDKREDTPHH